MSLDILGALEGAKPKGNSPTGPCKLQTLIDEIPADEPGRDDLVRVTLDLDYSSRTVSDVWRRLGYVVHRDLISDHRANPQRCKCVRA